MGSRGGGAHDHGLVLFKIEDDEDHFAPIVDWDSPPIYDDDVFINKVAFHLRDDDKGLAIMLLHRYPIKACRVFEKTDFTKLKEKLTCCKTCNGDDSCAVDASDNPSNVSKVHNDNKKKDLPMSNKKGNDGKKSNKVTLKTILGDALSYGPTLAEHIILDVGLLPNKKVGDDADSKIDEETIQALMQAITRFEEWLTDVISGHKVPEGFILMQNKTMERMELSSLEESAAEKVLVI